LSHLPYPKKGDNLEVGYGIPQARKEVSDLVIQAYADLWEARRHLAESLEGTVGVPFIWTNHGYGAYLLYSVVGDGGGAEPYRSYHGTGKMGRSAEDPDGLMLVRELVDLGKNPFSDDYLRDGFFFKPREAFAWQNAFEVPDRLMSRRYNGDEFLTTSDHATGVWGIVVPINPLRLSEQDLLGFTANNTHVLMSFEDGSLLWKEHDEGRDEYLDVYELPGGQFAFEVDCTGEFIGVSNKREPVIYSVCGIQMSSELRDATPEELAILKEGEFFSRQEENTR
jgi:hypothetical protein